MVMLASSVAAATFPIVFRTLSTEGAAATRQKLNENIELLFAVVAPVTIWLALAADQVAGTLVGVRIPRRCLASAADSRCGENAGRPQSISPSNQFSAR